MVPTRRFWAACGAIALLAGTLASAAQSGARPRSFAISSVAGRDNFDFYCAGCHALDARGTAPLAEGMTPRPRDLTLLARANGGVFPREKIIAYVRGSNEWGRSHGATAMPDWWRIFNGLDPSDVRTANRIANVVEYIESLQEPSTGAGDPGARLFHAYCATCHGDDARGTGSQVRHPMPDLTGFALKNGGVFPSARVYRIVEGRDINAHGSPEMPVWGRVFGREGADAAAVRERIDALVKYLASIQRRVG